VPDPKPKARRAYQASAMDSDHGCAIVWAETPGKARMLAASELDVQFTEIDELKRVPELDNFTGDLMAWQIAHGWSWPCGLCERSVYGESEGVVRVDDELFCNQEHANKAAVRHEERRNRNAELDAQAEELKRRALELRPGSTIDGAYMNEHGGVVSLTLPSGRHVNTNLEWLASEEGQSA
jgi:hypothetical protein